MHKVQRVCINHARISPNNSFVPITLLQYFRNQARGLKMTIAESKLELIVVLFAAIIHSRSFKSFIILPTSELDPRRSSFHADPRHAFLERISDIDTEYVMPRDVLSGTFQLLSVFSRNVTTRPRIRPRVVPLEKSSRWMIGSSKRLTLCPAVVKFKPSH